MVKYSAMIASPSGARALTNSENKTSHNQKLEGSTRIAEKTANPFFYCLESLETGARRTR